MKKLIISIFLILFLFKLGLSCSCGGFNKISIADLLYYNLIFKGKIIDLQETNPENPWENKIQAKFVVLKKIFPKELHDTITVYTALDEAACGLNFKVGKVWLIFGNKIGDDYNADFCSKSIKRTPYSFLKYLYRNRFMTNLSKKSIEIDKRIEGYRFKGKLDLGLPEGIWTKTKLNDTIEIIPFKNGLPHGKWIRKFENGDARIETNYINGKREGVFRQFNKNNELSFYAEYSNDKKNGLFQNFNDGNELFEQGYYRNGKHIGKWERYIDGKLYYVYYYDDNGNRTTKWEKYDSEGRIIEKQE